MSFERGEMTSYRSWGRWYFDTKYDVSCGDEDQRKNDSKHGASRNVQKSIWDKEDEIFKIFNRADGNKGKVYEYCGGWAVDYKGSKLKTGEDIHYSWIYYNPSTKTSNYVRPDIWGEYWRDGNGCSVFGLPTGDFGDTTERQDFDKGYIFRYNQWFWSDDKYYSVIEPIIGKYRTDENRYGLPTSEMEVTRNGTCQDFKGGRLCANKNEELEEILEKEDTLNGNQNSEYNIEYQCGAKFVYYQNLASQGEGLLIKSNGQINAITGEMYQYYKNQNECNGIGLPQEDTQDKGDNKLLQKFDNGTLFTNNQNRYKIEGDIEDKFYSKGGEEKFGFPKYFHNSDITKCGVYGRYWDFEKGTIYRSNSFGTVAVMNGPIKDHFDGNEGIPGRFGWPVADSTGSSWRHRDKQQFQRGTITLGFGITDQYDRGCGIDYIQSQDPNDDNHKALHQEEDRIFSNLERFDGERGRFHQACNTEVIDYKYLKDKDGNEYDHGIGFLNGSRVYIIYGDMLSAYWDNGSCQELGIPNGEIVDASRSPQGTRGLYQSYTQGGLYHSDKYGGIVVKEPIHTRYVWEKGGSGGEYGFTTGKQYEVDGYVCQDFEGGKISAVEGQGCEKVAPEPTDVPVPSEAPDPTDVPDSGDELTAEEEAYLEANMVNCDTFMYPVDIPDRPGYMNSLIKDERVKELLLKKAKTSPYSLPYPAGKSYIVSQNMCNWSNPNTDHYPGANDEFSIDFKIPEGDSLSSISDGTIIKAVDKFSEGGYHKKYYGLQNTVIIKHSGEIISRYYHLKYNSIKESGFGENKEVKKGDVFGKSGNTGFSSGAHLHFSMTKNNKLYVPVFNDEFLSTSKYYGIPREFDPDYNIYSIDKNQDGVVNSKEIGNGVDKFTSSNL